MSEQNIYEDFTPQKGKKSGIWNYFHFKVNRSGTRLERKVMYIVRYVTVPCHTIDALQTCGKADINMAISSYSNRCGREF